MDFIEKNKRIVKSSSIKIGKRTYFFDVKSTTNGDYYLVITESVRTQDGGFDKHKIFLYKEDFFKFVVAYGEAIDFMKSEKPEYFEERDFSSDSDIEE